mgnify:CR=1 FL=1
MKGIERLKRNPGIPSAGFFFQNGRFRLKARKEVFFMTEQFRMINGRLCRLVFCRYIRRNGKIVYPKRAKVFRFWIPLT